MDYTLVEFVDWMNIFTQNDGIAFEICGEAVGFSCFDEFGGCFGDFVKVRAFKPTPGPEPEESITEVLMAFDGFGPGGDRLVQIVLNEDSESVYMSLNAPAIVAVVLHYGR